MSSEIRIPDSSSVSQCDRDRERIPGWVGPELGAQEGGVSWSTSEGVWEGVLWGVVVASPFGHQLQDPTAQTIFQNFASSGDTACGGTAWLDILSMTSPCDRYLFKLKLIVVACIVKANQPTEQNYLVQWAMGDILPPQVFPTWLRRL